MSQAHEKKVRCKGLILIPAQFFMSQPGDQKGFIIPKVAADGHELMIPQRTMRPSIARVTEQLDCI